MKKFSFLAFGLIILTTCCYAQKLSDKKKDMIIKEVQERSHKFFFENNQSPESMQNFNSYIYEKSDLQWKGEPVGMIFNLNLIKTYPDKVNFIKGLIKARTSTNVTMLEDHFAVLSKDQVIEVNKGDYTVTSIDGKISGPFTMVNTIVWAKSDGEWKMLLCHESWNAKK
jgi:hypothetical protein